MTKGITFIGGKEFLLAGRYDSRERAAHVAEDMVQRWELVKVRKTPKAKAGDWSVWVHGQK